MASSSITTARQTVKPRLCVEPSDITVQDVGPDQVRIEVVVHNHGDTTSSARMMRIESAPLGAFVPWKPLAEIWIPPIPPGWVQRVRTVAERIRRQPQGQPPNIAPGRILAAAFEDGPRPSPTEIASPKEQSTGVLAADLLELIGQESTHWAGNLNIFIDDTPVERHSSGKIRIEPGVHNLAMFFVGSDPDQYRFGIECDQEDWGYQLFDFDHDEAVDFKSQSDSAITLGDWCRVSGHNLFFLTIDPPHKCTGGSINVLVEQKSTSQTAKVEFSFDPEAKGPGCYVL